MSKLRGISLCRPSDTEQVFDTTSVNVSFGPRVANGGLFEPKQRQGLIESTGWKNLVLDR